MSKDIVAGRPAKNQTRRKTMTFQKAAKVIDKLPAGLERGELQKLLTLVSRVVEFADLGDMVRVQWEMENIRLVAAGYAHCQRLQRKAKAAPCK